jgi:hypothetical protein
VRGHAKTDAGLLTGDDVVVTGALGTAFEAGGVGAGAGFRQRERDHRCPARRRRQPPRLDLVAAVAPEHLTGERGELYTVRAREIAARDLLHGDAERHEVGVLTAVRGRGAQAEQTELPHLPPRAGGKLTRAVPVSGARLQLLAGEGAQRANELLLLRREREIHQSVKSISR